MSFKRRSTSELTQDNWQEEDEPEDAGNFIKAPADILKNRVFKSARRRMTTQPGETPKTNAFSSFSGFNSTPVTSHASLFSFLGNAKPTDSSSSSQMASSVLTNGSASQASQFSFFSNSKPHLSTISEEKSNASTTKVLATSTTASSTSSFSFLGTGSKDSLAAPPKFSVASTTGRSFTTQGSNAFSFLDNTKFPSTSTPKETGASLNFPIVSTTAPTFSFSTTSTTAPAPQASTFSFKPQTSKAADPPVSKEKSTATTSASCSSSYASLLNFLANTKSSTTSSSKVDFTSTTTSIATVTTAAVTSPTKIIRKGPSVPTTSSWSVQKVSTTDNSQKTSSKKVSTKDASKESDDCSEDDANLYSKLKSLNECVLGWIKKCIDDDPACVLIPIFRDYQNHLKKILYSHDLLEERDLREGEDEEEEGKEQNNKDIEIHVINDDKRANRDEDNNDDGNDDDEENDDDDDEDDDNDEDDADNDNDKEPKKVETEKNEGKKSAVFSFGAATTSAGSKEVFKLTSEDQPAKEAPVFVFGNQSASKTKTELNKSKESPVFTFGAQPIKSDNEKVEPHKVSSSIFSQVNSSNIFSSITPSDIKNAFNNLEKNPFLKNNSFGATEDKSSDNHKAEDIPSSSIFSSQGSTGGLTSRKFSFGQNSINSFGSAGFSFGGGQPFSFGAGALKPPESVTKSAEEQKEDDDDEEPPKLEDVVVSEEGSFYKQRCKVFVKKDNNYSDRGVGTLFLKSAPNSKTQLIVRATTTLQSLLINTLMSDSMPIKRMNKTNIMIVCLPLPDSTPPPVPVLLRVKSEEEADKLFEALEKHKK